MKTTSVTQGAFKILVEQDKDAGFRWVLFLHGEVLDTGTAAIHEEAMDDAEFILQDFCDDEILEMEL